MNSSAAIDVCSNTETFMKLATTALTLAQITFKRVCLFWKRHYMMRPQRPHIDNFRELWYY